MRERVFAPDTLENDEALIRKCTTEAEINFQSDLLLEEHNKLKEKKEQGYDVSEKYDDFKRKLLLVKEMREKILSKAINKKGTK